MANAVAAASRVVAGVIKSAKRMTRHYDLGNFKPQPREIRGPTLVMDTLVYDKWTRKHDGKPAGQSTMLKLLYTDRGNIDQGPFLVMVYHVRNAANPDMPWRVACTNERGTTGLRSNCSPMPIHRMDTAQIILGAQGKMMEFDTQKQAMAWADAQKW